MPKNKKLNKYSIKEAQRAQQNVMRQSAPKVSPANPARPIKNASFTLPVEEIKKDLVKNLVFSVFAIAVIVALKFTNVGYSQLVAIFKF